LQVVAKVAMELGSKGTLKTITMAAMTSEDFINSIKMN